MQIMAKMHVKLSDFTKKAVDESSEMEYNTSCVNPLTSPELDMIAKVLTTLLQKH